MPETTSRRVCDRTGKVMHRTRGAAMRHLEALRRKNGFVGRVHSCLHCLAWHVGLLSRALPAARKAKGPKWNGWED